VIRHVSVLTFAADTDTAHVEAITTALGRLPERIPQLRDYRVGADLGIDDGNAHFVVVAVFDDEAGYRTYRDHPEHVAVARELILPVLVGRSAAQYTI
jgi:hypothetical protein